MAARSYAGTLPRMGGKPRLGLVHLAPALLWRTVPALVLPPVWRGAVGNHRGVAHRPHSTATAARLSLRQHRLCAGRGCDGHLGHILNDATDCRPGAFQSRTIRTGVAFRTAPPGTRDHSHLDV